MSLLGTDHADGHMQQCTTQPTRILCPLLCLVISLSPLQCWLSSLLEGDKTFNSRPVYHTSCYDNEAKAGFVLGSLTRRAVCCKRSGYIGHTLAESICAMLMLYM